MNKRKRCIFFAHQQEETRKILKKKNSFYAIAV